MYYDPRSRSTVARCPRRFDPKRTTVDAHSESSAVMKKTTEVEAKFIKQVRTAAVGTQRVAFSTFLRTE